MSGRGQGRGWRGRNYSWRRRGRGRGGSSQQGPGTGAVAPSAASPPLSMEFAISAYDFVDDVAVGGDAPVVSSSDAGQKRGPPDTPPSTAPKRRRGVVSTWISHRQHGFISAPPSSLSSHTAATNTHMAQGAHMAVGAHVAMGAYETPHHHAAVGANTHRPQGHINNNTTTAAATNGGRVSVLASRAVAGSVASVVPMAVDGSTGAAAVASVAESLPVFLERSEFMEAHAPVIGQEVEYDWSPDGVAKNCKAVPVTQQGMAAALGGGGSRAQNGALAAFRPDTCRSPASELELLSDSDYATTLDAMRRHQQKHDVLIDAAQAPTSGTDAAGMTKMALSYVCWVSSFASQQLDRQAAGLASNTSAHKGDSAHASRVITQHKQALEYVMGLGDQLLTVAHLKEAHRLLMQGLCPLAGSFRTQGARVGRIKFVEGARVESCLLAFLEGLHVLMSRPDVSPAGKASWGLYYFLAVHPFKDGNGRLGRILMNYILQRSGGFPFVLALCASDAQRKEYSAAFNDKRVEGDPRALTKIIGIAKLRAWEEFGRYAQSQEKTSEEHTVERFVRTARSQEKTCEEHTVERFVRTAEEARRGTCTICLEGDPNTATLCCGTSYHVACLIRWLTGQNQSCPSCRAPLTGGAPVPPPPPPVVPDPLLLATDTDDTTTDDTTTTEEDHVVGNGATAGAAQSGGDPVPPVGVPDAAYYNALLQAVGLQPLWDDGGHVPAAQHSNDTVSTDNDDSTTTVDEDDTTVTVDEGRRDNAAAASSASSRTCFSCGRNRYATDCTSYFCGRCCTSPYCPRHAA